MFELRKIGIVRRASALLLDAILLAVLTTGFMFIISLICNFDHQQDLANQYFKEWDDFRTEYIEEVSAYYGFVYTEKDNGYTIEKDGVPSSLDAVMEKLDKSGGVFDPDKLNADKVEEAYRAYLDLPSVATVNRQFDLVYNLMFMMASIGILLAYIVLEFVIPIFLKNGQTVGKKVFEIALVRADCVKITRLALFARILLGKFAIETMFPILLIFMFLFGGLGWTAVVLFFALTVLNVVLFFATKNRTPIHDMLAGTVAVDMKLQMIFESEEELIAKKTLQHQESVENTKS